MKSISREQDMRQAQRDNSALAGENLFASDQEG
jgi:hypothetical protein